MSGNPDSATALTANRTVSPVRGSRSAITPNLPLKTTKPRMQLSSQTNKVKTQKPKKLQPNSSRIREHLANERTYLAWMRTAISLMGFGVFISRLHGSSAAAVFRFGYEWKLGLVLAIVALLTVFLANQHYFAVRHDIEEDSYEFAERWLIILSIAVVILGVEIIYFVATTP